MFLRIYNTECDETVVTFTDKNDRILEMEDKVHLTLLINKYKWDDIL